MNRNELAEKIYQTAHLDGHFTLRSGQISNEYFDKYLFESDPKVLAEIARQMVRLIPVGTEILAGLEMGGIPIATALSIQTAFRQYSSGKRPRNTAPVNWQKEPMSAGKMYALLKMW